ncbi:hypothetical protein JXO52_13205 [bacterium]|nr:hypothetical protein [bacterium]
MTATNQLLAKELYLISSRINYLEENKDILIATGYPKSFRHIQELGLCGASIYPTRRPSEVIKDGKDFKRFRTILKSGKAEVFNFLPEDLVNAIETELRATWYYVELELYNHIGLTLHESDFMKLFLKKVVALLANNQIQNYFTLDEGYYSHKDELSLYFEISPTFGQFGLKLLLFNCFLIYQEVNNSIFTKFVKRLSQNPQIAVQETITWGEEITANYNKEYREIKSYLETESFVRIESRVKKKFLDVYTSGLKQMHQDLDKIERWPQNLPTNTFPELYDEYVFRQKDSGWELIYQGKFSIIKNLKGCKVIKFLLNNQNEYFSPIKILEEVEGSRTSNNNKDIFDYDDVSPRDDFDSSFRFVDKQTKEELEKSLRKCKIEMDRAEKEGDEIALMECRKQKEQIEDYLFKSFHKGKPIRNNYSPFERARKNIYNNISNTLKAIKEHDEKAFAHFKNSIETGDQFSYNPPSLIDWITE